MRLEMFGCYETIDFGPPVYMTMARCSAGCHRATYLVHPIALDTAAFDLLAHIEKHFREAFQRMHPETA